MKTLPIKEGFIVIYSAAPVHLQSLTDRQAPQGILPVLQADQGFY